MGVVVDSDGRVRGTLTDAGIRRAALNGKGMDLCVGEVMSETGVTVGPETSDEETYEILHAHRLRSIPVVADGRLVDVRSLSGFPGRDGPPIAVIMAGGRGQRLRPLTDKVPKPLLRVGSKSILERMIAALVLAGVRDVYLAVNYKAEVFEQRLGSGERLGVRLHYIREEQAMGTAGALSLLSVEGAGPILVVNGDVLTTVPLARMFDFHWRHSGAITLAGVEYLSHIPYGVLRSVEHHLLAIDEKPVRRDLCSAGMYVLEPQVLRFLAPGQPRDIPDLIADVLAEGLPVHVFPILEEWYDIGGTTEFERVLVQFATGEED
jgi:NDP-sugar pyrophosphorylase family protein